MIYVEVNIESSELTNSYARHYFIYNFLEEARNILTFPARHTNISGKT